MTNEQSKLWESIRDFPLDEDSALPFSKRLAQDNNWAHEYALRVIDEYKKFVFLGMAAGHRVTPSDEVDQAWHLHMLYTVNYWDEFHKLLPRKFHHGPTKGGHDEDAKYDDWYSKTKESYTRLFEENPPDDIWPSNKIRFGRDAMRLYLNDYVIISKKDYPMISRVIIWFFKIFLNK